VPALIPWPFPVPEHFLGQLGYARTVEAFDSLAMRARLAELPRRQGSAAGAVPPPGPRRFVLFHWQPAGDELAFSDGVHSGAGQLQHWLWLDYLHGRAPGVPPPVLGPIGAWLVEHQVDLGSSDAPATHALIVDGDAGAAWVAPIALARRIVSAQSLGQGPAAMTSIPHPGGNQP
jgi:hypothetical protein